LTTTSHYSQPLQESKKAIIKKFKAEKALTVGGYDLEEAANLSNPKKGPTIPVALTSELGGGMRRMIGKGGGLQDSVLRMEAQGKVNRKTEKAKRREGKVKRRPKDIMVM
jgi:hypothetical protein